MRQDYDEDTNDAQLSDQVIEQWLSMNGIEFSDQREMFWHGHILKCDDVQKITLVDFIMQQDSAEGVMVN